MKQLKSNTTFEFSTGEAAGLIGMDPASFQHWISRGFAVFRGEKRAQRTRRGFGFADMKHLAIVCVLQRAGLALARAAASAAIIRPEMDKGMADGFVLLATLSDAAIVNSAGAAADDSAIRITVGDAHLLAYAGDADRLADVFARLTNRGQVPESVTVVDLRAVEKALAPIRAAYVAKYRQSAAGQGRLVPEPLTPAAAGAAYEKWAADRLASGPASANAGGGAAKPARMAKK